MVPWLRIVGKMPLRLCDVCSLLQENAPFSLIEKNRKRNHSRIRPKSRRKDLAHRMKDRYTGKMVLVKSTDL